MAAGMELVKMELLREVAQIYMIVEGNKQILKILVLIIIKIQAVILKFVENKVSLSNKQKYLM